MLDHVARLAVDVERPRNTREEPGDRLTHDAIGVVALRAGLQQLGHVRERLAVAMNQFELPYRRGERLMGTALRALDLATRRDLARQVAVRFAHCGEPGLERGLRTAQRLLGREQLRYVAHDRDFADEPALGIDQRRGSA